jgi:hypothetical protein
MKRVSVSVQNDYLERMSKTRPINAVAELVWNSLDADADKIKVKLSENRMGGLERLTVTDNGHGLEYALAERAFGSLGGSWKKTATKSRGKKRFLHGRQGKGRFSAFALGQTVEWRSKFKTNGKSATFSVIGKRNSLGTFEIGDEEEMSSAKTGMEVVVQDFDHNFPSLLGDSATQALTEQFALYLAQYRGVSIEYNGVTLDPSSIVSYSADYPYTIARKEPPEDIHVVLTVVEWKCETERALYYCDADGLTLKQVSPIRIHAPSFWFSAYLKSAYFRELEENGTIDLEELNPDLTNVVETAKTKLREHFRKRAAETAASVVEEWKKTNVYPYESEPRDVLEEAERQVFDVVALNLNSYSLEFERSEADTKKLVLKLLRTVLGTNPPELQRILSSVIELPEEKQKDLAELLSKTTLQAIINAAKIVTNRLDFLKGIEELVFDTELKERLLERKQLHRILATEPWIFGEQYHLALDDESLTKLLKKHNELLKREVEVYEPVVREGDREGVVDLMLSKLVPLPRGEQREHLVIELKRPTQKINSDIAQQIKSYAMAVVGDERFKSTNTRWVFWAISNDLTKEVEEDVSQANRPEGILYQSRGGDVTVWVKTWAEVLQECEGRMKFYKQQLEYSATQASGLEHLKATYEKYLPDVLKPKNSGTPA